MVYNMDTSVLLFLSSNTLLIAVTCAIITVIVYLTEIGVNGSDRKFGKRALLWLSRVEDEVVVEEKASKPPGPTPYPVIGNLACLDGYEVPYQAFEVLGKQYGPIISLRLGSVPTVVVNGVDNIKEVLITKTSHFDSRPDFRRYHSLFGGDKQNSLAFSNWSDLQKTRRDMLIQHSFPRNFSTRFNELNIVISNQMHTMIVDMKAKSPNNEAIEIKPFFLEACANTFTQYYCSRTYASNDRAFKKMISNFDKIFWEVNQGYAADFMPFLLPLHKKNLQRMQTCAHEIREFILTTIIEDRKETWTESSDGESDYVECLIDHVNNNLEPKMEWDTALYALEDIIGGHSAVANFLVKVFGYIGCLPEVQKKMQQEIDETLAKKPSGSPIDLSDRMRMPYTEAVIMEALRLIASPIVPHVASRDSTIGGYVVEKDSLIFLNNYELSMSADLWDAPTEFKPERFIQNGHVVKPDHFLPFGAGRRSCMGYKMVQFLSFSVLTSCMQQFDMSPKPGTVHKVQVGSLAVPEKSYEMVFTERK